MNAEKACLECLSKQADRAMKLSKIPVGEKSWQKSVQATIRSFQNVKSPPPEIAVALYQTIASVAKDDDVYEDVKTACIQKAKQITDVLEKNKPDFSDAPSELEWALKAAVLGNVIDYGSASGFVLEDRLFDLERLDFGIFDSKEFFARLSSCKNLVYIADNAGENLFDEVLLKTVKKLFPRTEIFYFVRGAPIINDLTRADLENNQECKNVFALAEVIDSGVKSPGYVHQKASPRARRLFDCADVILAKGMGNFECLEEFKDPRLFLLFKIKCEVVASHLGIPLGKTIFKNNRS